MKTKEEMDPQKTERETLAAKPNELNEDDLEQVTGGGTKISSTRESLSGITGHGQETCKPFMKPVKRGEVDKKTHELVKIPGYEAVCMNTENKGKLPECLTCKAYI